MMDYEVFKEVVKEKFLSYMGKVDEETLSRITEGVQVQVGVFDRYN